MARKIGTRGDLPRFLSSLIRLLICHPKSKFVIEFRKFFRSENRILKNNLIKFRFRKKTLSAGKNAMPIIFPPLLSVL